MSLAKVMNPIQIYLGITDISVSYKYIQSKLNPTLCRIQISVQSTALILDYIYHTQPLQTGIGIQHKRGCD